METKEKERFLSPSEVRNILNSDIKEIVSLCKEASVTPKKSKTGKPIFSFDDVKILRNFKIGKTKKSTALTQKESQNVVENLLLRLSSIEKNITNSVSKVIDEKLDGMDDVVVELIRCKKEIEALRQKINELNKENYKIKNEINSYKSIGLGLYLKKTNVNDQFDI